MTNVEHSSSRKSRTAVIAFFALAMTSHAASIKDVDFANFTYPSFAGLKTVHLQNGDYCSAPKDYATCVSLVSVVFGDLTGDGKPEAAVTLSAVFRFGNGLHTAGFVYTIDGGHPRLIGRFAGGDRSYGGIGKVRIHAQRLIVSRGHGRDAVEEDTFKWNGRHLVLLCTSVTDDD